MSAAVTSSPSARAAAQQKELFIIDGATHMDLYVGAHVGQVMAKLTPFYQRHIG